MQIELANASDFPAILAIFRRILEEGETYSYGADMPEEEIREYWMGRETECYVARIDGEVAGATVLKPNRSGRANHVANASFMVAEKFRGRGVAKALGAFAIARAKEKSFAAMQFNFVVSTNTVAVNRWKSLGFEVVGVLPKGFQHRHKGLVDVYIMHRFL